MRACGHRGSKAGALTGEAGESRRSANRMPACSARQPSFQPSRISCMSRAARSDMCDDWSKLREFLVRVQSLVVEMAAEANYFELPVETVPPTALHTLLLFRPFALFLRRPTPGHASISFMLCFLARTTALVLASDALNKVSYCSIEMNFQRGCFSILPAWPRSAPTVVRHQLSIAELLQVVQVSIAPQPTIVRQRTQAGEHSEWSASKLPLEVIGRYPILGAREARHFPSTDCLTHALLSRLTLLTCYRAGCTPLTFHVLSRCPHAQRFDLSPLAPTPDC